MKSINRVLSACFFFLILAGGPLTAQSPGWTLKNDKDGVKVYYRTTGDIHEIKLSTSLQTTLTGIMQLFAEVDKYPQWGYKVSEARLLKRISAHEVYYYSRLDFPWPMSDRDLVMHTKVVQDGVTRRVVATSTAVPDYLPEVKDVVRMREATTKWILLPRNDGWVDTEYIIHSDPGGAIPGWMVNMAIDVGPRETIASMRNILNKAYYQNARLAHIKD
jgi:hypothetical protein